MEPVLQQLAKCGLRADGRTIRRRYQRLLRKYKELRDHNEKTGMAGLPVLKLMIHSIALAIIHLFSLLKAVIIEHSSSMTYSRKIPTVEIDTVVDESGK